MSDVETYEELDAKLTGISNRRDASKLWVDCMLTLKKIVFIQSGHYTCALRVKWFQTYLHQLM